MPGKQRYIRSIDLPLAGAFDAGPDPAGSAAIAPPSQATIGPPTNLLLTTAIERSATTASARIAATWYPPAGVAPSSYVIQWSTSAGFPDGSTNGQAASAEASTIGSLAPATLYYVRVAAIVANLVGAWSATSSIATAADTTPPNPVTSLAWAWGASGDLEISWVDPTSANLKRVEIKIWSDAAKTIFYRALYAAPGALRTTYTAAMNALDTSNIYDISVFIEVKAQSWGNIDSSLAVPVTQPSKAVPATPTGLTSSWAGDTGSAGADCVISWARSADALSYRLTIDGVARELFGTTYTYTYASDRAEHSNTPDPVLTIALVALDGLNQASAAAALTATNATPPAPTLTLIGGQNQLVCSVTSAPVADFLAYEYVWKRDGSTIVTLESAGAEQQYAAQTGDEGAHSWTCTVRQKDGFGLYSTATVSSAVMMDALTIGYLRAGLIFSDSVGTALATLAVLKDGITASGGQSYNA